MSWRRKMSARAKIQSVISGIQIRSRKKRARSYADQVALSCRSASLRGDEPDPDEIGRVNPGVGEMEAAGAADAVAQRDRPAVLEQCDRGGGAVRDRVVDVPDVLVEHVIVLGRPPLRAAPSSPATPKPISAPTMAPNASASSGERSLGGSSPRCRCRLCGRRRGRSAARRRRRAGGRARRGSRSLNSPPSKPTTSSCTGPIAIPLSSLARKQVTLRRLELVLGQRLPQSFQLLDHARLRPRRGESAVGCTAFRGQRSADHPCSPNRSSLLDHHARVSSRCPSRCF